MAHLDLATLIVRDYDAAIRFFVDVLQFELVEDSPSQTNDGRRKRWVVVRPRTANERTAEDRRPATGLLLAQADGDGQRAAVGRQFAGRVGLFLRVDDFADAYQRMLAAGVRFINAPRDEPYGRVVVFEDCEGNRWDLLGPRPQQKQDL